VKLPGARIVGLAGLLAVVLAASCGPTTAPGSVPTALQPAERETEPDSSFAAPGSAPTATPRPLPTATVRQDFKVEMIAEGVLFPQSMTFAPDGRMFFVQVKQGLLRVMRGRELQEQPVLSVRVPNTAEHGLVSVTLDPGFAANHYLYTYYTKVGKGDRNDEPDRHRLTRWIERDGQASGETDVLNELPVGKCCHTGGKLAFAADGSAFLTVGDQGDASRREAQNRGKANGKLLRFDVTQVMAQKEPDPRSLVYASGLRNPYGLDVHPVTGDPFVTDNGPDMCDELNIARPGANFGNPVVECSEGDPARFDNPAWETGPDRLGVTGLRIYRGAMFPELENQPLFCAVNTGNLMRAVLSADYKRVERVEQLVGGADGEGCRLDVAVAADGSIYYSSLSRIYRLYR
jgi:glucose/arabinose dehydrogenase